MSRGTNKLLHKIRESGSGSGLPEVADLLHRLLLIREELEKRITGLRAKVWW